MLVDSGYYVWKVAVKPDFVWSSTPDLLFALDSRVNYRLLISPDYKSSRYKTFSSYSEQVLEKIRKYYDWLKNNRQTLELHGYEADDIIALSAKEKTTIAMGEDKDLLQLPNLILFRENLSRVSIEDFRIKQPKWVQPMLETPRDIQLFLALVGDKADNVPRLLKPRDQDTYKKIHQSNNPFSNAYEIFGEDFLVNIKLVVLPCPLLLKDFSLKALDEGCLSELELKENIWK